MDPQSRPKSRVQTIQLSELPQTTQAPGWLIEDVKRNGVLETIVLGDKGDEGYVVISGERRISAARACGMQSLQASVLDWDDIKDRAPEMAVALNELRASNHLTNLTSVRELVEKGVGVESIASRTGLTVPSVRAYLACSMANGRAVAEFASGGMTFSTLRKISRLPREMQTRLAEDQLAPHDVGSGFTARALSAWLKTDEFDVIKWTERAVERLNEIIDGPIDEEVRAKLDSALSLLTGRLTGPEGV